MGTDTETKSLPEPAEMSEAEMMAEILTTMRRVDALLTEYEPLLRGVAGNPALRFALGRSKGR